MVLDAIHSSLGINCKDFYTGFDSAYLMMHHVDTPDDPETICSDVIAL